MSYASPRCSGIQDCQYLRQRGFRIENIWDSGDSELPIFETGGIQNDLYKEYNGNEFSYLAKLYLCENFKKILLSAWNLIDHKDTNIA